MLARSFKIDKIVYQAGTRWVQYIFGQVPMNTSTEIIWVKFRWDKQGHCYSIKSHQRHHQYDLSLCT